MDNSANNQGLEWLAEEIEASLREAGDSLEKFLLDSSDIGQLRECQEKIHQVSGSIGMLGIEGPGSLAVEMDVFSSGMVDGHFPATRESSQLLLQAVLTLSESLQSIAETGSGAAGKTLPLVNSFRALRSQDLAIAEVGFAPKTDNFVPGKASGKIPDVDAFSTLIGKLKQMYQLALSEVSKGENIEQNLTYLQKVVARMKQLSAGTLSEIFWQSSSALLDAVSLSALNVDPALRSLLRGIGKEVAAVSDQGYERIRQAAPETLLTNILFYVGIAGKVSADAGSLIERCELEDALSAIGIADGTDGGFGKSTSQALMESFNTEIGQIKDSLDRYAQGESGDEALKQADQSLQNLIGTLAVVGLDELQQSAEAVRTTLSQVSGRASSELPAVATQIVSIESAVYRSLASGRTSSDDSDSAKDLDSARLSLSKEVRRGLERVKEAIVEHISSQWDATKLDQIPEKLSEISGALAV
ncbi:MAG: hypothetical protein ACWA5K_00420, partial [bacterium]